MKELSLYLLDLSQNSVAAGSTRLTLSMVEGENGALAIRLADNGRGMSPEFLSAVGDPFTTTRTTRKVGLGIPLLRQAAEQTGGSLAIESTLGVGTAVTVTFYVNHIDCPPMGDLPGALAALVQGAPEVALDFTRKTPGGSYEFSTDQMKAVLGEEISLAQPEVYHWMKDYLAELEQNAKVGTPDTEAVPKTPPTAETTRS
ncbi:MAG: ATP-binding protein [Oscillospiraceae bacterium]